MERECSRDQNLAVYPNTGGYIAMLFFTYTNVQCANLSKKIMQFPH